MTGDASQTAQLGDTVSPNLVNGEDTSPDAALARVVAAWPKLSPDTKAAVLAIVGVNVGPKI